jgi:predicted Fe-S protein YdhL (DUF1289 family)
MIPSEKICAGCGRTLREIGGWSQMSTKEREAIVLSAHLRMTRITCQEP